MGVNVWLSFAFISVTSQMSNPAGSNWDASKQWCGMLIQTVGHLTLPTDMLHSCDGPNKGCNHNNHKQVNLEYREFCIRQICGQFLTLLFVNVLLWTY